MNHQRPLWMLVAAILISGLILVPLILWLSGVRPPTRVVHSPPPAITHIQSMSDLATTKVQISDYIKGENNYYVGKWALHGEVVLGVALSKAKYGEIDKKAKQAVLLLPYPHMISSKVDHERSEELYMRQKPFRFLSSPKSLRDGVWKQAERKIKHIGQKRGYSERAKVQAERVLVRLFQDLGWKVSFRWQSEGLFNVRSLQMSHN